jgi:hypothetical protein
LSIRATLSTNSCNGYHITYLSARPSSSPHLSLYFFFKVDLSEDFIPSTCFGTEPNKFRITSKSSALRILIGIAMSLRKASGKLAFK